MVREMLEMQMRGEVAGSMEVYRRWAGWIRSTGGGMTMQKGRGRVQQTQCRWVVMCCWELEGSLAGAFSFLCEVVEATH